jgi:hypothetical protein
VRYDVEVGLQADISRTLDALAATTRRFQLGTGGEKGSPRLSVTCPDRSDRGRVDGNFRVGRRGQTDGRAGETCWRSPGGRGRAPVWFPRRAVCLVLAARFDLGPGRAR